MKWGSMKPIPLINKMWLRNDNGVNDKYWFGYRYHYYCIKIIRIVPYIQLNSVTGDTSIIGTVYRQMNTKKYTNTILNSFAR